MVERDMWLGAVIGAALGAAAWQIFLSLESTAEDAGEALFNLWTGIWVMGTLSGDADWLGYLLGAAVGAFVGFIGMKTSVAKRQYRQSLEQKAAAAPHPMD